MAKIKTIGDAYMAVAGAPAPDPDHAATAAAFSLDLLTVVDDLSEWPGGLRMRVGIHSGPVVAGVIGRRRLAYDLWGDTVNVASRMESHGEPGAIQVSAETRALLHGRHTFEGPRRIVVKGLGERDVFRLAPDGAP